MSQITALPQQGSFLEEQIDAALKYFKELKCTKPAASKKGGK